MYKTSFEEAAKILANAKHAIAFTGAGVSVESGIPPFRGPGGLWSKYDPVFIDLAYFRANPEKSWQKIAEIFYDFMGKASPNSAHTALARLEQAGILEAVVTQNIDHLHQDGGSTNVVEFHGTTQSLGCMACHTPHRYEHGLLQKLPPLCRQCGGILKPDFIFFGEAIPEPAGSLSFELAQKSDVILVIGTNGEVMPASSVPVRVKFPNRGVGGTVIELNLTETIFTSSISDYFFKGYATQTVTKLAEMALELKQS